MRCSRWLGSPSRSTSSSAAARTPTAECEPTSLPGRARRRRSRRRPAPLLVGAARRPYASVMTAATLQIEPLDATFGAVVRGVELRSVDDATQRALYDTWIEHALLIFPGQFLTKAEQEAFALRFAELEFATVPISNLDKQGNVHSEPGDETVKALRGNEGWHHDSTYMPMQAKGAVFSAEIVPA